MQYEEQLGCLSASSLRCGGGVWFILVTGMKHATHASKMNITLHSGAGLDNLALRCSRRQCGDGASLAIQWCRCPCQGLFGEQCTHVKAQNF